MESIIKDVKVINPDSTINNADVIIENNFIKEIIPKSGEGSMLLIPGFIDTHIHGMGNYDVMEGAKALQNISTQLSRYGTTSFMPTLMTNSWETIIKSLKEIAHNEFWVSRNLGFHIEGPFIGNDKKGAHKQEFLLKATKQRIKQLAVESEYNLKKISFDPSMMSIKNFKFMQEELHIIGSIGHSSASYALAEEFFKNGCTLVCHLWNAMSGVDSRNPGIAQAALYHDDVYTELIIDFVHSSKETILFTIKNKTPDKIIAVSDAIKPAYYEDGENISGGVPVFKKGKLITLLNTNTIAGSGIMIYDAFVNLVKIGISLNDAVKMTSYNAAKHLGHCKLGKIEKNFLADFIIMNPKNYKIKSVYIDGRRIK
ncbi:N-acetylglucosamine-6-phosphate deacetylase [Mycoplasmopsis edwardii]|nr:N-acetylglucosamine-6-phosphate deacetylase [Mycoplasmopsis edwardii]